MFLCAVVLFAMASTEGVPMATAMGSEQISPQFVGASYFAPGAVYTENFPDPSVVWDPESQKYYAYATTTGGVYVPVMWSTDLVRWTARTSHGLANANGEYHDALPDPSPPSVGWTSGNPSFPDELWSPSVAKISGTNGSAWFMFYSLRVDANGKRCIYYASSSRPDGPFTAPQELHCGQHPLGAIDPQVFADPSTGKNWLLWKDEGEVGQAWAALFAREIVAVNQQRLEWAPTSFPVFLLEAQGGWERGVAENPSMIRLSGGVPTLFYSVGLWNSDEYSLAAATCGPLQFSWTPICRRIGNGPLMRNRVGMKGIGGSTVFAGSDGAPRMANHYWEESRPSGYPGNQRRLVVDTLYETVGGIAFSHSAGPAGAAVSSGYVPDGPTRILDTRSGLGTSRIRKLETGEIFEIDMRSRTTATTTAVAVNVTIDDAEGAGFATVFSCGQPPLASSLNYERGSATSNLAIARLNPDRKICVFTSVGTHLIVDFQGRYDSSIANGIFPVGPSRVLDTRSSVSVAANSQIELLVVGQAGIPVNATAVLVSLTVDRAGGAGFLTAWQCDSGRPTVSNVNYGPSSPSANGAVVPLSVSGSLCIYSQQRIDVIVDVFGYVGNAGKRLSVLANTRVVDTRLSSGLVTGGQTLPVTVTGIGLAASGAAAVVVNLTAVDARADGWVSVFPCSAPPVAGTETSVLNVVTGQTKASSVVVPVGVDGPGAGKICVRTQSPTHVIVDLLGGYN